MLVGTEIAACVAVPVSVTVGGVAVGTLRVAVRIPGVVGAGANATLIWQVFPAAMGFGVHADGAEKSPAFGPEIAIAPIETAVSLELAIVTV